MDEELRTYLDTMRREFNEAQERTRLEFNDTQDRLLKRIALLERDLQNTKGFLTGDALVAGRRRLELDERVNRLEQDRKAGH